LPFSPPQVYPRSMRQEGVRSLTDKAPDPFAISPIPHFPCILSQFASSIDILGNRGMMGKSWFTFPSDSRDCQEQFT